MATGRAGKVGFSLLACALSWVLAAPAAAAVLQSISVDGDMGDWGAVLADPWQTAHDGPWGGLVDLDAPVPSNGRDLVTFAWTYDLNRLYFYVERVGSTSNRQLFWFYVDTDEDGLMETGEPVVGVSWWGKNRNTRVSLYTYTASAPGGDPLGDPSGMADGWDLPGPVSYVRPLYETRGGARGGLEMEASVAWSDLGVAPATPLRFHVGSSNSENVPGQIHDNMGGPGGLVGTTRFAGVLIQPKNISANVVPAGDAWLPHLLTNTGQNDDRFDLAWSASGDFSPTAVTFWFDVDGDGRIGPSDTPMTDTDGNGFPDTGTLPPGAFVDCIAVVTAPAGIVDGESIVVDLTAASSTSPGAADTSSDTVLVAIPAITLVKTVDRATAVPGDTLSYMVTYTSSGSVDAHQVVLLDEIPPPTVYEPGSASGPGAAIEFSHDGGVSFDGSETAPVTHIRWSFPSPLSPGETGSVSFRVSVP